MCLVFCKFRVLQRTQFMTPRNYAKSFDGFKTRVLAKITALTTIHNTLTHLFLVEK